MKKSLTILLSMLFLCVGVAWAQTTITGSVVTQEEGDPIVGATIRVVGTQQGTVSDGNGRFSLSVPSSNSELQVSYLGYVTQTVRARNGMTIALVADDNVLDGGGGNRPRHQTLGKGHRLFGHTGLGR